MKNLTETTLTVNVAIDMSLLAILCIVSTQTVLLLQGGYRETVTTHILRDPSQRLKLLPQNPLITVHPEGQYFL